MPQKKPAPSDARCPVHQPPGGRVDLKALGDDSLGVLAGIIDSAMDAIITVDERQNIVLFNKAAERMFRCPRDRAIGQSLDTFIPQRYREAHRRHVHNFDQSQVADRAMGMHKPLAALRADGEEFPIEASISQAELNGRKHFTAIVRDISERLRAQRLLSEIQARYRTVFDHAGVGILMIDHQGNIAEANPACEKMLGYSVQQLRGQPYSALAHPRDARAAANLTLGKKPSSEVEMRFIRQDKKHLWARVVHTAVRESAEKPLYHIAIIEDISAKKRAQLRLKRLRLLHENTLQHLSRLTVREREVMWLMVDGHATKVIASELGTSPKTIDVHRSRVMEKMEADSLAQLVQKVLPIRKHVNHLL